MVRHHPSICLLCLGRVNALLQLPVIWGQRQHDRGRHVQTRDNAWDRISAAALVDEQEVLRTPFLQGFWLGLSDLSWNSFSREYSTVLASSNRLASWSSRTNPNPMAVVVRRLRIW